VYNHWRDSIAKDIQAFNKAKRMVRLSNPTGVTVEEKHSMAVAIHLGKVKKMDYGSRGFDVTKWPNYLAYKVLMDVPKFSDANAAGSDDVETENEDDEDEEVEFPESVGDFNGDFNSDATSPSSGNGNRSSNEMDTTGTSSGVDSNIDEDDNTGRVGGHGGSGKENNKLASSSRKTKRTTTAREEKNAARGKGPGKKSTMQATADALLKENNRIQREKRLQDIHKEMRESNKIARQRLNEQQKANNVMTIAQAHSACFNSGDTVGAAELHQIMLNMARAAAHGHNANELDSNGEWSD
jgi:hypothetical protein